MIAPILSLREVSLTFGGKPLFGEVSLALGMGNKVCLVGRNGSGKSTDLPRKKWTQFGGRFFCSN